VFARRALCVSEAILTGANESLQVRRPQSLLEQAQYLASGFSHWRSEARDVGDDRRAERLDQ